MSNAIAVTLLVAGWLPLVSGIVRGKHASDLRTRAALPVDRLLLYATWMWCIALTLVAAWDVRGASHDASRRVTAGVLVFLAGTVSWTWARRAMGDRFAQVARVPAALVRRGPYRYLRHPMYVATAVAACGQALAAGTTRAAALALAVLVILGVRAWREEGLLAAAFGPEWDDYAARTFGVRSSPRRR
jgi:protein-S-isoprenylcysteine O-methyltransferase Ste14